MTEEPLQAFLEVEGDVFPGHEALFDGFGDLGLCLLGLLVFSVGFVRLFTVPGSGEKLVLGV